VKSKIEYRDNHLAKIIELKIQMQASQLVWDLGLMSEGPQLEISNFYQFYKSFSRIWERYHNRISPLLSDFNYKSNIRHIYAEIIAAQYSKYLESLEQLEVPPNLISAFNRYRQSIIARKCWVQSYRQGIDSIYDADHLDYQQDYQFWCSLGQQYLKLSETNKASEKPCVVA